MSGPRDRHLTLVVPGLRGPGAAGSRWWEGLALPALTRFLSRADPIAPLTAGPGLAATIFGCFPVDRAEGDWPVAAVTAHLDGDTPGEAWWLRADPVHLRVDPGALVLADPAALRISLAEAEALTGAINAELGDEAPRLRAPVANRWYLRLDAATDLETVPPSEIWGGAIGDHLPAGSDAAVWRAWTNDVQMILHGSPVNRAREERGVPAVNSVWLWGGGRLPRVGAGRWQSVTAGDPLALGLGALSGASTLPAVDNAGAWLARNQAPGDHLLIWESNHASPRLADADAWREGVTRLEQEWMAPLLDALAQRAIRGVRLCPGDGVDYLLRRRELGRWWRRRVPPARILTADT